MTTDTQDRPATVDVEAVLALLPAEVRPTARLRLAAVAEARTDEERARIKATVVDETLKAAKSGNWCASAEAALTMTFGEPDGGRWVMADGYDRNGYDAEGFNREGFHRETGRDREGFDAEGYDADGINREGFDRHGYNREGLDSNGRSKYRFDVDGWDPDGFNRLGMNREGYDREGYDRHGNDREGRNRAGEDRFRYDLNGVDREGYNSNGQDYYGYTRAQNAQANRPPRPTTGRDHPAYDTWHTYYQAHRGEF